MSLSARTKIKPPASSSATYSATGGFAVNLSWTPKESGQPRSYFVVYRDGNEIATSLSAATYRDETVTEGVTYFYEIATVSVNEVESAPGAAVEVSVPSFPIWETGWVLSIDQNTTESIAARASDPGGQPLTFSKVGGTAPAGVTVSSAGVVSVGVTAGGAYTLIIRASNGTLASDFTAALTVTVPVTQPGTPINFAAAAVSASQINLSWQPSQSGQTPTSYELDRSLAGSGGWTNILASAALSFSDTGLSANTQYFYRVRAIASGVPSASYATADATTQTSSNLMSWHPGHYLDIPVGQSNAETTEAINYVNARSYLKGLVVSFYWNEIETSQDVYNWTRIDSILSQLGSGKYFFLKIQTVDFNSASSSPSSILPAYLNTATYSNGAFYDGQDLITKVWDPNTMTRKMAMVNAIGARYNSHAKFEGVVIGETAMGLSANQGTSGYTANGLVTQLERLYPAARLALPNKQIVYYCNFISGGGNASLFARVHQAGLNSNAVASAPDSLYLQGGSTGMKHARGALGALDLRGKVPLGLSDQNSGMNNTSYVAADLVQWGLTVQMVSYMYWRFLINSPNFNPIMNYLAANPNTVVTTCPSQFSGCSTS